MSVFNPVPGATYGTATINFGAAPGANEASVAVTGQTLITAGAKCVAFIMGDDTSSNHTAGDHKYFEMFVNISCGTPSAGTGFTIYARSQHKMTGNWTVRYFWIN